MRTSSRTTRAAGRICAVSAIWVWPGASPARPVSSAGRNHERPTLFAAQDVNMADSPKSDRSSWVVFLIFLRLGLTSFGGPVAHLGYFRHEFVQRRQWLSDRSYADLVALCQFLPGPASSQVGMAVGLLRAGLPGALAAWLGFTLPSALVLALLGVGLASGQAVLPAGAVQGLKVVAVAVVAQAVWGMARQLCVGRARVTLMASACGAVLVLPGIGVQVLVMLLAAAAGWWLFGRGRVSDPLTAQDVDAADGLQVPLRRRTGVLLLLLF